MFMPLSFHYCIFSFFFNFQILSCLLILLQYPSMSEKYPALPAPRIVAAIDPRYNNSVQMLLSRQHCNSNGKVLFDILFIDTM